MNEIGAIETLKIPISKDSVTGTIATVPSDVDPRFILTGKALISKVAQPALVVGVHVVRTTIWNQAATLKIGTASNDDYFSGEDSIALNTALPAGEAAAVLSFKDVKYVADLTAIKATFAQAAATAGAGFIVIEYRRL